jgi:hypothetical protein
MDIGMSRRTVLNIYNLLRPHDLKTDFQGEILTLREQTVNQWREFVVTVVLANYQKASRSAHNHSDRKYLRAGIVSRGLINCCIVPSQPSWSLMQALLSLASYLHSVDTPSNSSRLQKANIALMTLRQFTTSFVEVLATRDQASRGQRESQAKVWDLRFLRWLLTLWTTNWDGLSELDQLIEKLQVCAP